MVATYDFYKLDPTIIALSRVFVKWNVIFFNVQFFSYGTLTFQKMADWNELSSIVSENENFAEFTDSRFC